jgi:hypothetical protein
LRLLPTKHSILSITVRKEFFKRFHSQKNTFKTDKDKLWHTVIFPTHKPSGRKEVFLLEEWLNNMLHQNLGRSEDPLAAVKEAEKLYSIVFNEIIRQVWVTCAERGQLMQKIWHKYMQLFEHILKMREQEKDQYSRSKEKTESNS